MSLILIACATPSPDTSWTKIDNSCGDVHAAVFAASRAAIAKGLTPVLYIAADYTVASAQLQHLRNTPPMRDALSGLAVIQVDSESGFESASFWHSFHALDRDGNEAGASLDPGTKNGPCADGDETSCAAWIRPFARSLAHR